MARRQPAAEQPAAVATGRAAGSRRPMAPAACRRRIEAAGLRRRREPAISRFDRLGRLSGRTLGDAGRSLLRRRAASLDQFGGDRTRRETWRATEIAWLRRHQFHRHRLRLIAIERVGHLHVGGWHRERARRLAGLAARRLHLGARRLGFELQRDRRHRSAHDIAAAGATSQCNPAKQQGKRSAHGSHPYAGGPVAPPTPCCYETIRDRGMSAQPATGIPSWGNNLTDSCRKPSFNQIRRYLTILWLIRAPEFHPADVVRLAG